MLRLALSLSFLSLSSPSGLQAAAAEDDEVQHAREDELRDISADICWHGSFTKDYCCVGDETTTPACWDGVYSFSECCPNADCWDDGIFTYETCCGAKHGASGNEACWAGAFSHNHCCLANGTARNWADVMVDSVDTEQFYAMDEFYTDAQYGDDFGYYSKGHVLHSKIGADSKETQQFAHFTTYPMILSPHFGRVFCRLLFIMWINLGERSPFRVIEMGGGSGQLGHDIGQCVRKNELGIAPAVWRRWESAFEYLIMERSPALAKRQRERGLNNIWGDAQSLSSCKPVLKALAQSLACTGGGDAADSPECQVTDRGTSESGASVVMSNELLDAFAPIKLRLSLYGHPNMTNCGAWQEVRLVHTVEEEKLRAMLQIMGHEQEDINATVTELKSYTGAVFCAMANTTIGREARARVPDDTSCLALAFGLGELVNHLDLGVPAASHNMRMRIRKDEKLWTRLREIVLRLDETLSKSVAIPRNVYRQLRAQLKENDHVEAQFLKVTNTYHVPVTISNDRCLDLEWWFEAHKSRVAELAQFYTALGYPALHIVVRPGERNFIDLVDCLLHPAGGFKLSLDYGAAFEGLAHSLSIDPQNDGIFVPPIPQELMQDLPECHAFWPKCAGRIDWTTFVDFTNLAAAGERLGWRTLFYGPQSLLEQGSRYNMTVGGKKYSVPGYTVTQDGWQNRHVSSWYGREILASEKETGGWVQRWTSFKALLLEKPSQKSPPKPILFPSWHLDTQDTDKCWNLDFTTVPLADWIPRQGGRATPRKAFSKLTEEINDNLGRDYAIAYEEAQLAVRIIDWLVARGGCESLRHEKLVSLLTSEGLWQALETRLKRRWGQMWGDEAVTEVARIVIQRLVDGPDANVTDSPPACAGAQTYVSLCEDPGGGSIMQWRSPV